MSWPDEPPGGILLATRAKGIYKPAWSEYALSIRNVFKGPYADGQFRSRTDGSWTFEYCQEGHGDDARALFTNRALYMRRRPRADRRVRAAGPGQLAHSRSLRGRRPRPGARLGGGEVRAGRVPGRVEHGVPATPLAPVTPRGDVAAGL